MSNSEPDQLRGWFSAAEVADELGIAKQDRRRRMAVKERLRRLRHSDFGSWLEVCNPHLRGPRYVYAATIAIAATGLIAATT